IAGGAQHERGGSVELGECAASSVTAVTRRAFAHDSDDGPVRIEALHAVAIGVDDIQIAGSCSGESGGVIEAGGFGGNRQGVVDDGPTSRDYRRPSIAPAATAQAATRTVDGATRKAAAPPKATQSSIP